MMASHWAWVHGIFPQVEGLTDGHLATLARTLRSHSVRPGRNQDELHAQPINARVHERAFSQPRYRRDVG